MAPQCLKCSKPVYMSDEVRFEGSLYHQKCINCTKCHKSLNIFSLKRIEQDFYCESCYKSAAPDAATKKTGVPASSSSNLKSATAPKGDICPVCSKPVYFAESITAVSRKFHKLCFKCSDCGKLLESSTLCDKDSKIYCKGCYGKNFGPKGCGYGQGAGALTHT